DKQTHRKVMLVGLLFAPPSCWSASLRGSNPRTVTLSRRPIAWCAPQARPVPCISSVTLLSHLTPGPPSARAGITHFLCAASRGADSEKPRFPGCGYAADNLFRMARLLASVGVRL